MNDVRLHVVGTEPAWVQDDPEWRSALHVLDAPVLRRKDCRQWVDFERREIDFAALLETAVAWSSGERLLLRAAWDLFNGEGGATLGDLVRELDDENLNRVIEAARLRRA